MIEYAPKTNEMTYEEAVLYCQFLNYGGHNNWRLPTCAEYWSYVQITSGWYEGDTIANQSGIPMRWSLCPVRTVRLSYISKPIDYIRIYDRNCSTI